MISHPRPERSDEKTVRAAAKGDGAWGARSSRGSGSPLVAT